MNNKSSVSQIEGFFLDNVNTWWNEGKSPNFINNWINNTIKQMEENAVGDENASRLVHYAHTFALKVVSGLVAKNSIKINLD